METTSYIGTERACKNCGKLFVLRFGQVTKEYCSSACKPSQRRYTPRPETVARHIEASKGKEHKLTRNHWGEKPAAQSFGAIASVDCEALAYAEDYRERPIVPLRHCRTCNKEFASPFNIAKGASRRNLYCSEKCAKEYD